MNYSQQAQSIQEAFPYIGTTDLDQLFSIGTYKQLKKKEKLAKNESILFFILKGAIRGYFYNEEGEEKNVILKFERHFSGMPALKHRPLKKEYIFEAIDKTELLLFEIKDFEKIAFQSLNLSRLYIQLLNNNIYILLFRIEILASKSPEERYQALIEHFPHYFQKTYHKHIANYLGMTPNSLSRIIKRYSKE